MTQTTTSTPGEGMEEENPRVHYCFGCSAHNPIGLHLSFTLGDGEVRAPFTPQAEHQGWPGFMHGGLVATLLDEAMGWVIMRNGAWAVTGKMNIRYRDLVPLHQPLTVIGRIEKDRRRWLLVKAEVQSAEGVVLSEADAIFMRVSGEQQRRLEEFYRGTTIDDVVKGR
jgi:acyl-coenzyme A thioesterase PaaI-like protein